MPWLRARDGSAPSSARARRCSRRLKTSRSLSWTRNDGSYKQQEGLRLPGATWRSCARAVSTSRWCSVSHARAESPYNVEPGRYRLLSCLTARFRDLPAVRLLICASWPATRVWRRCSSSCARPERGEQSLFLNRRRLCAGAHVPCLRLVGAVSSLRCTPTLHQRSRGCAAITAAPTSRCRSVVRAAAASRTPGRGHAADRIGAGAPVRPRSRAHRSRQHALRASSRRLARVHG